MLLLRRGRTRGTFRFGRVVMGAVLTQRDEETADRLLLEQIARRVDQIARGVQETTMEVVRTPSVFTIAPIDSSRFDPRKIWSKPVRITLWCTHPGAYHPVFESSYETALPKEWFAEALPYLRATLRLLRFAPVVGGALAGGGGSEIASTLRVFEVVCKAVEEELSIVGGVRVTDENELIHSGRHGVEGPNDRAIKKLLLKLGERDFFSALHKVSTPSDGIAWVCETHLKEYSKNKADHSAHLPHSADTFSKPAVRALSDNSLARQLDPAAAAELSKRREAVNEIEVWRSKYHGHGIDTVDIWRALTGAQAVVAGVPATTRKYGPLEKRAHHELATIVLRELRRRLGYGES